MNTNTNTKPVATLGALLTAITETIAASEQRVMARLDDIENRIVGLEDKITELGKQADEIKEDLQSDIADLKGVVETNDTSALNDIAGDLDVLADAERRREWLSWLADARKVG